MAKISNRDTRTSKDPRNQQTMSNGNTKFYNMRIDYKGSLLTLTSPGGKSITIDLSKIEDDLLEPQWIAALDRLDGLRAKRGDSFTCSITVPTLAYFPLIKAAERKSPRDPVTPPTPEDSSSEKIPEIANSAENPNLKALSTVNGQDTTLPEPEKPSNTTSSKLSGFVRHTQEAEVSGLQRISRGLVQGLEQQVASLKAIDRPNLELWCVNYDIPCATDPETGRRLSTGVVPNPSDWWWAFGARLTLSQWLFTREGLEDPLVQECIQSWLDRPEKDVKVRVVKQCPSQTELLRGWAREKLQEMVGKAHQSMIDCIATAHDRWQAAEKALDEQQLNQITLSTRRKRNLSKLDQDTRNVLRAAAADLNNAIKCAEQFDMTEDVQDLLRAFRLAVHSQRQSFNAEARARGATPSQVHVPEIEGQ